MDKVLMTGNEAVARGAFEAGCTVATGYPGTPSSEILENLKDYDHVHSQWSVNEKVAVESACGVSAAGGRAISTMKVVGLNVAMDPLMTFSYMGVNGGLVIIVGDDPGCSSSQNEQDNRQVAPFAKIPLIEPSNPQECKDFMKHAFEISEKFDVPVLFRMTTRVCHSKGIVELGEREEFVVADYEKTGKYQSGPALSRKNHLRLENMLKDLSEYANTCEINTTEWGNKEVGIITSGISYHHAKEVFGDDASYLKLGLTHAFPEKLVKEFAEEVDTLYVIEENEPFLENRVRLLGIDCIGKDKLPITNELSPSIIKKALLDEEVEAGYEIDVSVPERPAVLCAGCPHRTLFYAVSKQRNAVAANDIGCYTLGSEKPLSVTDTIICMGAGISAAIGLEKTFNLTNQDKKVFGFIGDSTFYHSGITGLIDAVWNKSNIAVCILDNSTTAMTGHQEHPGTGKTLMGEDTNKADILSVVKATGVKEDNIRVIDAYDFDEVTGAVKDANEAEGVFVIISKRPCALIREVRKERAGLHCVVNQETCTQCGLCMKVGCPAISKVDGKIMIDEESCNGCGLCRQVCAFDAIEDGNTETAGV